MTAGHEERSVELQHVFRFMIFDSVSKLYRLRYDWCRKLKVNFALLTPSVKIKGRVCEMSTLPVQLSPEPKVWFTFDGAPFGCLRDKRCRGGSKGAIGASPVPPPMKFMMKHNFPLVRGGSPWQYRFVPVVVIWANQAVSDAFPMPTLDRVRCISPPFKPPGVSGAFHPPFKPPEHTGTSRGGYRSSSECV